MFPDDNNKIRIFPSSNRSVKTKRYGDNFVTEYNLSSLINKLLTTDIQGFVISMSTGTNYEESAEFNIAGYFIRVDHWNTIINPKDRTALNSSQTFVNFITSTEHSKEYIVARININKPEEDQEAYWQLTGEDIESNGSNFPDNPTYSLKLLLKVNDKWIINPDAKLKFSNINIDDGRIS